MDWKDFSDRYYSCICSLSSGIATIDPFVRCNTFRLKKFFEKKGDIQNFDTKEEILEKCNYWTDKLPYLCFIIALVTFVAGIYFSIKEKFKNENKKKEKFINKYNSI